MSNNVEKILFAVFIIQLIGQSECIPPPVIEDLIDKLVTTEKESTTLESTTTSNPTEEEITTIADEDYYAPVLKSVIEALPRCIANQEFVNGECREVVSFR